MDAEIAARADAALRRRLAEDRYAGIASAEVLASLLTHDLFELTHDKHLAVSVAPDRGSSPSAAANPDDSRESVARRSNFGVQRVEILPGNIGYLNITWFFRLVEARQAISAAMQVLRNADALILDLRTNGGGSPETVAYVASYLFHTANLPLFDIIPRSGDLRVYRTEAAVLPGSDGARPLYALTSKGTFSAGEGLAFILQERSRAAVVGETTAGAANPGRPYPLNARFAVTIPNGKVQSAIRRGNWEGSGVAPDVKATASEALRVAQLHALQELVQRVPTGPWRNTLEREIRTLEQP
jgi:C-terminal processing protease CtpA/Prc